ncbi:MAG: response regulator [Peptococcaceae bacterium]|nr:response regulator [Peptococcaceae bacterium]
MSKFRILWIDDQKTKCKRDVRSVERIIETLGYEADIQLIDDISAESLSSKNGTLNKAIRARDVDLFIIDYNLKNDLFGGDVVEEIRWNNDIYTDIVFYSSVPASLIDAVQKSFESESSMQYFDGVYIAPLGDEFTEKIRSVIVKIIKSWYNVHSIRGIVLSKASKFEQMISTIININYYQCLDKLKNDVTEKGDNVCNNTIAKWSSLKKESDPIPKILNDPINFNWKVKEMLLERLCSEKIISISVWEDIKNIFSLRNNFAHNPMHLREGVLVLSTRKGEEKFDENDIDEIRAKLTRIEDDLQRLIDIGGGQVIIPDLHDK